MNKELNLDKLSNHTREELEFFVKLLAKKLEQQVTENEKLKGRMSGKIGIGGKKNPNVK